MITPLDVQKRSFTKTMRGYRTDEVEEFMELIANSLEKHITENIMLKEKLDKRDEEIERYKHLEQTMSDTLVVAKQTSEEMIASAKQQALNIVEKAEQEGRTIVGNAEKASTDIMRKREMMERDLEAFRLRMEAMLKAQLDIVNNYSVDLK